MRHEWEQYFERNPHLGRVNDGEILNEGQDQRLTDGPVTAQELVAAMKATKSNTAKGLDGISFRDLKAMNQQQVLTILNGMLE